MSHEKQSLNGAFYGPSIPPPPNTYHRPGRGLRGGCCLCNCLLSCLCSILISILVILGLAALLFWLIVRPHEVKFYATDASLTEFALSGTGSDTLAYDLAVNFTVRNPNRRIGIYYDVIDVRAYYDDQRFGATTVGPFYQGHKNTTVLGPVTFQGQNVITASSGLSSDYSSQKSDGVFDITVKLYLQVRFKLGWVKVGKFKPKIECELEVPLSTESGKSFETTKCKYDL